MSAQSYSSRGSKGSGSKLSTKPVSLSSRTQQIKVVKPKIQVQPQRRRSVGKSPATLKPPPPKRGTSAPPRIEVKPPPPDLQTVVSDQGPEEDAVFSIYTCCLTIHENQVLRQLFWLFILLAYTVVGGIVFSSIEGTKDKSYRLEKYHLERERYENYKELQRKLVLKMRDIQNDKTHDRSVYKDGQFVKLEMMVQALKWYERKMGLEVSPPAMTVTPWDYWGGIFYACTLYTTIGYGNFSAKTLAGRLTSMGYALLGIPLLLVVLCNLGALAYSTLNGIWTSICNAAGTFRKKQSNNKFRRTESESSATIPLVHVISLEGQIQEIELRHMEQMKHRNMGETVVFPFKLALLILIVWVSVSGILSTFWQTSWSYFTGIFFQFISVTTIGLGDELIEQTSTKLNLATLGPVFGGFIFLSMTFYVVQAKIALLYHRLSLLIDDDYRIKQADPAISGMAASANAKIGLSKLVQTIPISDRVLYLAMDDHRKHLLEEYWLSKAQMVNKLLQTQTPHYDIAIQTGMRTDLHLIDKHRTGPRRDRQPGEDIEDEEEEEYVLDEFGELVLQPKKQPIKEQLKKYIYFVTD